MLRPILIHPDPRLKKVCDPVAEVDGRIDALIADMLATMYDAPGIGLAAPQIGVNARLFVMDCANADDGEAPDPVAMINPEIVATSEETHTHSEGCLSIPEIYEDVTRPAAVQLRYVGRDGEEASCELTGLRAVCAQHELDHLNGKLFIDYLGPMKRQLITQKMKKLKRERARENG
ncbi:peptide deformylase [Paralimibaculum aggregatum]|uniref:Peptide deformylase n=1 Tax=Paralimibaculum aggregatum TaxID=3036245 RepID=A0ABQ6LH56_9RHOB|nr:peptide deformylase [Limibaculum sp. NKW23]GMG80977.1 peptide deformylase [Limibaculum sp. NKW23]